MQRFGLLACILLTVSAVAGCSGGGKGTDSSGSGEFTLGILDTVAKAGIQLKGAYLHAPGGTWAEALSNGTAFTFDGSGGNETAKGDVAAGSYDRLRLVFGRVSLDGKDAVLTQSGIELAVNLTVSKDGASGIGLAFSWPDSFFQSAKGLAFTPVLTKLTATQDGAEVLRLDAAEISSGSGKAPVARMRIFDSTGLEVFLSTFVADSPEKRVVGNAGNITLSATSSEALQPGAHLSKYTWDIQGQSGQTLGGVTAKWVAPLNGGNFTVRLTVEDSDGNKDTQTVAVALKPGTQSRTYTFTGSATQSPLGDPGVHTLPVDVAAFENASANLTHMKLVLSPGSATVPVSDLDVAIADGEGNSVGAATGQGSQHTIDKDVSGVKSGDWKVTVTADPGYDVAYTVVLTLTWKGVNPALEAWLKSYDDGHTHQH